ncbi:MAG: hypothetical protein KDA30_09605, partial [Phycisphaerales bacterium]|nr:hypothetical protein [Phycisphaerales bacterium]
MTRPTAKQYSTTSRTSWIFLAAAMLAVGVALGVLVDRSLRLWSVHSYLSSRPGASDGSETTRFITWGWNSTTTLEEVRAQLEPMTQDLVAGYTQTADGKTHRCIVASINYGGIREYLTILFADDETLTSLTQSL